jgi:protease II
MTSDGSILKDAGLETRWVKLDQDLFLYFTRLDPKGLPREVWRVKVNSSDASNNDARLSFEQDSKKKTRNKPRRSPKLVPELVMRENDERNVLSISQTNDKRFILIEVLTLIFRELSE